MITIASTASTPIPAIANVARGESTAAAVPPRMKPRPGIALAADSSREMTRA